jgi:hypothetical protein
MTALMSAGVVLVVLIAVALTMSGKDRGAVTAASTSMDPVRTSKAPAVTTIPKPDTDQAEELLYGLGQVDRELDRARSIDRARNTCSDILAGESRTDVVERTRLRFDGTAQISTSEARAIVKLIEAGGWCRN